MYFSRKIKSVETREIVLCGAHDPIFKAAQMMADNRVSCLFIGNARGEIDGFVTDITLRDKVVAKRRDPVGPISDVMDNHIVSIDEEAYAYEAILLMFQTKSRYLLVTSNGRYVGFLSRNKLLSEQAESPLVFIQSVKQALSSSELARKWGQVPEVVNKLLDRGVNSSIVNQVITAIADTIAQNVIEEVLADKGQPPAKFVFMVLGSEGRKEQTLKTDQDNAIIYEDRANEHREEVRKWFLGFAENVSDRLNSIGFVYCTGGFMAKNPVYTHSLSHWKKNYQNWMDEALPETVIKFSTFFDCRFLYGSPEIMQQLREFLDKQLQQPLEKFFVYLAQNALQYEPPLNYFNQIKTFSVGGRQVFDIKKVMTPVVDLVRVYALRNRIFELNTGDRIEALKDMGVFNEGECKELLESYYYLMEMRLRTQANRLIRDKMEAENYIELKNMTKMEKAAMKEVFKSIENFQAGIRIKFTNNLLG
ncbi:CBS domain-containing protein [bacterium A37T11]|nr:CBS domain-containing protein [bacterium A37T11]